VVEVAVCLGTQRGHIFTVVGAGEALVVADHAGDRDVEATAKPADDQSPPTITINGGARPRPRQRMGSHVRFAGMC